MNPMPGKPGDREKIKNTVRRFGRIIQKGVGKVMEPTVRVMKKNDAKMKQMDEDAKAGKFN